MGEDFGGFSSTPSTLQRRLHRLSLSLSTSSTPKMQQRVINHTRLNEDADILGMYEFGNVLGQGR